MEQIPNLSKSREIKAQGNQATNLPSLALGVGRILEF